MIQKVLYCLAFALVPVMASAQSTLISNVNGYTLKNGQLITFHALEFSDDKITRLYQEGDVIPTTLSSPQLISIDGQGKTLLPGLIDAHGHVLGYGLSLLRADLTKSNSEQDAVKQVRDIINKTKVSSGFRAEAGIRYSGPRRLFQRPKV